MRGLHVRSFRWRCLCMRCLHWRGLFVRCLGMRGLRVGGLRMRGLRMRGLGLGRLGLGLGLLGLGLLVIIRILRPRMFSRVLLVRVLFGCDNNRRRNEAPSAWLVHRVLGFCCWCASRHWRSAFLRWNIWLRCRIMVFRCVCMFMSFSRLLR